MPNVHIYAKRTFSVFQPRVSHMMSAYQRCEGLTAEGLGPSRDEAEEAQARESHLGPANHTLHTNIGLQNKESVHIKHNSLYSLLFYCLIYMLDIYAIYVLFSALP